MNLDATIKAILTIAGSATQDIGTAANNIPVNTTIQFATGAGANQANEVFADTRTLADSGTENLDLSGTALQNAFGTNIAFARVKAIYIKNKSTTQILSVGGAASNQFINWVGDATDIIKLRPGGILLLVAPDATGYAVTAATGDLLKILNGSAGTATDYDIVIIGALT